MPRASALLEAHRHESAEPARLESWAEVFPDSAIASAVLDRLVRHAYLVPIVDDSFRIKNLK